MLLTVRPARWTDANQVLTWRNDPVAVAMSRSQRAVTPMEHQQYYITALNDPTLYMSIALVEGVDVGYGRVKLQADARSAVLSLVLDPAWRGKRLATPFILKLVAQAQWAGCEEARAVVKAENVSSCRAFTAALFYIAGDRNADWLDYRRPL